MVCSILLQDIDDLTSTQVAIYAILAQVLIPLSDCS